MPTLPPPLGLGLPPHHLGLGHHQAHQLGLPFQQPGEWRGFIANIGSESLHSVEHQASFIIVSIGDQSRPGHSRGSSWQKLSPSDCLTLCGHTALSYCGPLW